MPSYVLHLLHGKRVFEILKKTFSSKEKNQYYIGLLLPDAKNGGEKAVSHFYSLDTMEDVFQVPDLSFFVRKYKAYLNSPLVLGYVTHLYLDWAFFSDFIFRYVQFLDKSNGTVFKSNQVDTVLLLKQQRRISTAKFFSDSYLYGDYTKINKIVLQKYEIVVPFYQDCKNLIDEVEISEIQTVLRQLENYLKLDNGMELHLSLFDFNEIDHALQEYAEKFIAWLNSEM